MNNADVVWRLIELLLKEKEDNMKAKQQDKTEDNCSNT